MLRDIYEITIDGQRYILVSNKLRWDYPGQRVPVPSNASFIVKSGRKTDETGFTVRKIPSNLLDELVDLAEAMQSPPFVRGLLDCLQDRRDAKRGTAGRRPSGRMGLSQGLFRTLGNDKKPPTADEAEDDFDFGRHTILSDRYLWLAVKDPQGRTVAVIHKNTTRTATGYTVEAYVDSESMREREAPEPSF